MKKIRTKLLGGFFIVLLLLGVVGVISRIQMEEVNKTYSQLIEEQVSKVVLVKNLQVELLNQTNSVRGFLVTEDPSYIKDYEKWITLFDQHIEELLRSNDGSEIQELVYQADKLHQDYQQIVDKAIEFKQDGKETDLLNIMKNDAKEISGEFNKKINGLIQHYEGELEKASNETTAKANSIKFLILSITIIAIASGITIAFIISRNISNPIIHASEVMQQVAKGDLTIKASNVKNRDEIGLLIGSLNIMLEELRTVVGEVNLSAEQVASSSEELAASADQSNKAAEQVAAISQRNAIGVEHQLSQLNDVTTSVDEMTEGIHQIANSSERMIEVAEKATDLTKEGAKAVDHVVEQMNKIHCSVDQATVNIQSLEKRSNEINHIIGIITGIADQTNLLALNAAIEAARAGEHGKGFAVVAGEVRKLAEESKVSADRIKQMIEAIQEDTTLAVKAMNDGNTQVDIGLSDSQKARLSFDNIAKAIEEVSGRVHDVSSAVQELTAFSDQINHSIHQAKDVAQESAFSSQESSAASEEQLATMEEVAASAQNLSELSEHLQKAVSRFKN